MEGGAGIERNTNLDPVHDRDGSREALLVQEACALDAKEQEITAGIADSKHCAGWAGGGGGWQMTMSDTRCVCAGQENLCLCVCDKRHIPRPSGRHVMAAMASSRGGTDHTFCHPEMRYSSTWRVVGGKEGGVRLGCVGHGWQVGLEERASCVSLAQATRSMVGQHVKRLSAVGSFFSEAGKNAWGSRKGSKRAAGSEGDKLHR